MHFCLISFFFSSFVLLFSSSLDSFSRNSFLVHTNTHTLIDPLSRAPGFTSNHTYITSISQTCHRCCRCLELRVRQCAHFAGLKNNNSYEGTIPRVDLHSVLGTTAGTTFDLVITLSLLLTIVILVRKTIRSRTRLFSLQMRLHHFLNHNIRENVHR